MTRLCVASNLTVIVLLCVLLFSSLLLFIGWSRSSSLLSDKLVRLKLRAEMTQQLEASTGSCREAQQCYSSLLNTPLPPSPLLADTELNSSTQSNTMTVRLLATHSLVIVTLKEI